MNRKILLTIFVIFILTMLAGCNSDRVIAAHVTSPTPEPEPKPKLSVSGKKCDLKSAEIFSYDGKAVFSECEVRKNAKLFNGKTIRISSKYGFMIHGSFLTSDNCDLSKSIDELISVGMAEKDFYFLQHLKREGSLVDIDAVGVFSESKPTLKTDSIYDRTPYHFFINCLEKAEVIKKKP